MSTTNKRKSIATVRQAPTEAELEAASREFETPDYTPRFTKAPRQEQLRHDRALRAAKRRGRKGRPRIGKGAERIQITLERGLLAEADTFAKRAKMSRSELIAQGLRMALAS